MKIDMAKATVAWLTKWKEDTMASHGGLYVRSVEISEISAKRQYIRNKMDFYVQDDMRITDRQVTMYVSDLYSKDILLLGRTRIHLPDGVAVIDSIEADLYYEPYSNGEPSKRLELTFTVPAKTTK